MVRNAHSVLRTAYKSVCIACTIRSTCYDFGVRQALLLFAIAAAHAFAAEHGPPIGAPMPAFEAPDQNGQTHTLKDIVGHNGAAIVFYRSADW